MSYRIRIVRYEDENRWIFSRANDKETSFMVDVTAEMEGWRERFIMEERDRCAKLAAGHFWYEDDLRKALDRE